MSLNVIALTKSCYVPHTLLATIHTLHTLLKICSVFRYLSHEYTYIRVCVPYVSEYSSYQSQTLPTCVFTYTRTHTSSHTLKNNINTTRSCCPSELISHKSQYNTIQYRDAKRLIERTYSGLRLEHILTSQQLMLTRIPRFVSSVLISQR